VSQSLVLVLVSQSRVSEVLVPVEPSQSPDVLVAPPQPGKAAYTATLTNNTAKVPIDLFKRTSRRLCPA
jgi:hypothetical protein